MEGIFEVKSSYSLGLLMLLSLIFNLHQSLSYL